MLDFSAVRARVLKLGSASGVGSEMFGFSTVSVCGWNLGSASGVASEMLDFTACLEFEHASDYLIFSP